VSSVNGDKAKDDVQSSVDTVNTLPEEANTPKVTLLDFEDQPFWIFDISTQKDIASLMRFSKKLKENIEKLNKVDRVILSGLEQQEVQVAIDPQKALDYNISANQLSQLVKKATSSYPAGILNTEQSSFSLSIDPIATSVEDIRNLTLQINHQSVRLGDIATVAERSTANQDQALLGKKGHAPSRTVQLMVYKSSSANIDAAEKDVRTLVDKEIAHQHNDYKITSILNTSDQITKQFNDLFSEFRSTIILVFLLLLVFLGLKQALISTLTIPLTFLSAFAIIQQLGMSLNFLTMFAFLLALGLLIDDTIVVVAAMTRYYNTGKFTPYQTGILVWKDFIVPLWSTTITTIWAFVPLLLSTGIIGEFIKPIPIVVTATMLSSTSIAVFITIPLMVVLLKPQLPKRLTKLLKVLFYVSLLGMVVFMIPTSPIKPLIIVSFVALSVITYLVKKTISHRILDMYNNQKFIHKITQKIHTIANKGLIDTEGLSTKYAHIIHTILISKQNRRNTLIAIIAFVLIGYLLVPLGFVKSEFFPKTNQDLFYINVEMPKGTRPEIVKSEMKRLLPEIEKTTETEFVIAESGHNIDRLGIVLQMEFFFCLRLFAMLPR
jgi:multidrug efflux pump subunit AcrB